MDDDHDRLPVGRWLRAEYLQEDVLGLLDELGELNRRAAGRVRSVGRIKEGRYGGEREAFTPANPVWAAVEGAVYGAVAAG